MEAGTLDGIELLELQHDRIRHLMDEVAARADDLVAARQALAVLTLVLSTHTDLEEEHLYPILAAHDVSEIVAVAWSEHHDIRRRLEHLAMTDSPGALQGGLAALRVALIDHMDGERDVLFPRLRQLLSPALLEALGRRVAACSDLDDPQGQICAMA